MNSVGSVGNFSRSDMQFGNNAGAEKTVPKSDASANNADTITIAGKTIKKKTAAIGAAAILTTVATIVTTGFAMKRGKTINAANGNETKILNNIKEGFKSIFTKDGRDAYKKALNKAVQDISDVNIPAAPVTEPKPKSGKKLKGKNNTDSKDIKGNKDVKGSKPKKTKSGTKPDAKLDTKPVVKPDAKPDKKSVFEPSAEAKAEALKRAQNKINAEKTAREAQEYYTDLAISPRAYKSAKYSAEVFIDAENKAEALKRIQDETKAKEVAAEALKRTQNEIKAEKTVREAQKYYTDLAISPKANKDIMESVRTFNEMFNSEDMSTKRMLRVIEGHNEIRTGGDNRTLVQKLEAFASDVMKRVDKTLTFADGSSAKIIFEGPTIDITSDGKILQKVLVPNSTSVQHIDVTKKFAEAEKARQAFAAKEAAKEAARKNVQKARQLVYA